MRMSLLVSSKVALHVYLLMIALAGLARGFTPKRGQEAENFSTQSKRRDLLHDFESKLLHSRKSLITDDYRKAGSNLPNGREEDALREAKGIGGQFTMASSKHRVFSTLKSRSNFVVRSSAYESVRASPVHSHVKLPYIKRNNVSLRHKRRIFPPDNRRRISNYQASNRFPYSATVKISTGCTGSLISNQHVLTAAHCIHNRTHYITRTTNIRVGFLKNNGKFRWFRVTSVRFPRDEWMNSKGSRYDYAVLTLSKPHKRKFFRLAVPSKSSLHIYFSSFPGDKRSNTLWYVDCSAVVLSLRPSIMCQCDASKGSSGAGVYTVIQRRGKNKRVIIGVLSGATDLVKLPSGGSSYFNIAVSLKAADIRDICRWAGSPRGCPS